MLENTLIQNDILFYSTIKTRMKIMVYFHPQLYQMQASFQAFQPGVPVILINHTISLKH